MTKGWSVTTWPSSALRLHANGLIDNLAVELLAMVNEGSRSRILVGIAGAPGSGKSTVATMLANRLGPATCVVVPMDGFHLADDVLRAQGMRDRKGAIDTFDASGYVSLLERIAAAEDPVVYAPTYRRGLEEPIAGAIPVPSKIPIVLTEGNYLLVEEQPWLRLRDLTDAIWYVELPSSVRQDRLKARHEEHGMTGDAARSWTLGPDEANARLVAKTRQFADRVVTWA